MSSSPVHELPARLLNLLLDLLSYALGFAVIGRFWLVHHRIFGVLSVWDGRLMALNLPFLGFADPIPFTSVYWPLRRPTRGRELFRGSHRSGKLDELGPNGPCKAPEVPDAGISIFVSCRRADTPGYTGWLSYCLEEKTGARTFFVMSTP